ncbi:SIMPL domain-containing protein [Acidihalobacter ferrooxydans]|uniref:SIMPL domain-containing protein n=1 Tax=Acidihalobacter ferrooxydans TaxID=1765967 RepID=A0A1P8UER0_9GAMM|nr:SIMPL domain-containing protein [Acidihalobacter ferrooxydans]APZ42327.1 hypothetical protein BW247_03840 [Acidihalobacter ferrooxydans]
MKRTKKNRLATVVMLSAALPLLFAAGVAEAAPAQASAQKQQTVVSFAVTTSTAVPNTRLVVLLQAVAQASGDAQVLPGLAKQLNRRMNTALQLIEKTPGVVAQTRGMRSAPVYVHGKQTGWRLTGQIEASGDAALMPQLTGRLQAAGLSVESVQARPSAHAMAQARTQQTVAAIDALKHRAATVARALGCSSWSFAQINLDDQTPRPPVGLMRMAVAATDKAALAPGRSTVTVRAAAKLRCVP